MNKLWTFFVLDFDGTYDNDPRDSYGVKPLVYLVPFDKVKDVQHYANEAHDDFHSEENQELDLGIANYFEEWMNNNGIDFKLVGSIDLTFEERQYDYIVNYIPMEVV